MSWLGSGLSQITGQISNFTKEVLTEGTEEVDDHATELRVAKARNVDLEGQNYNARVELERVKHINEELTEKLQSAELQIKAISTEYREKLQHREAEIIELKQKHNEVLEVQSKMALAAPSSLHHSHTEPRLSTAFGGDDHDFDDIISAQYKINQLQNEAQRLGAECRHWKQVANSKEVAKDEHEGHSVETEGIPDLHSRNKELEQKLAKEIDQHQHELAALQNVHAQKLAAMSRKQAEDQRHLAQLQEQLAKQDQQQLSSNLTKLVSLQKEVENLRLANERLQAEKHLASEKLGEKCSELESLEAQLTRREDDLSIVEGDVSHKWTHQLPSSTPARLGRQGDGLDESAEIDQDLLQSSFTEVSLRNKHLEEQIGALQAQIHTYEQEMGQFDLVKSDWMMEKEALEAVLVKLRSELKGKEESLAVVQGQKSQKGLEEQSSASTSDINVDKLCHQVELLAHGNSELEQARNALAKEKNELKAELEHQRSRVVELEAQTNESTVEKVDKLMEELKFKDSEMGRLTNLLQDQEEKLADLTSQFNESSENLIEKEAEIAELEEKLTLSEEALTTRTRKPSDEVVDDEIQRMREELRQQKLLVADLSLKEKELEEMSKELKQREDTLKIVEEEKMALETSLEDLDSQHQEAIGAVIATKEKLSKTNEKLKEKVTDLETQLVNLSGNLSGQSSTRDDTQMASLEAELSQAQSLVSQLQSERDQHDEKIKEMTDKLEAGAHALNNLYIERKELETQVKELAQEAADVKGKFAEVGHEKQRLERELKQTHERLQTASSQSQLQAGLQSDLKRLGQELNDSQDQSEVHLSRVMSLEKDIGVLQEQLTQTNQDKLNLSIIVKDTERRWSNQHDKLKETLEEKIATLSVQVSFLESQKDKLEKELKQSEEKCLGQAHQYENYIKEINEAKDMDASSLEKQHQRLIDEAHQKDRKISELEFQCEQLQQKEEEMADSLMSDQEQVTNALNEAVNMNAALERENKALQKLNEEQGLTMRTLQDEVSSLRSGKNMLPSQLSAKEEPSAVQMEEIEKLQKEIEKLQRESVEKDQRLENYQQEVDSIQASVSREVAMTEPSASGTASQTIQQQNTLLQALEQSITEKDEELAQALEKLDDAKAQLEELQQRSKAGIPQEILQNGDVEDKENEDARIWDNRSEEIMSSLGQHEELTRIIAQKDEVILELRNNNGALLKLLEERSLTLHGNRSLVEIHKLQNEVKGLRMEKEQIMSVLNDKTRECSSLKSEVHKLMNVVSAEKTALSKLQKDNQELLQKTGNPTQAASDPNQDMTREAVKNLSMVIRDKDLEIESLSQKNQTLLQVLQEGSVEGAQVSAAMQERDNLMKQLQIYQKDREQIIVALNQKHQESVTYHHEIQRLHSVKSQEMEKAETLQEEYSNLRKQYEDKQQALLKCQNELLNYKQKFVEVDTRYKELLHRQAQVVHAQVQQSPPPTPQVERLRAEKDVDCSGQQAAEEAEESGQEQQQSSHLRQLLQQRLEEISQANHQLHGLRMALQVKERDLTEHQRNLVVKDQVIKDKDSLIKQRDGAVAEGKNQIRQCQEEIRRKEMELISTKKQMDNLTFQIRGLQTEVNDAKGERDTATERADDLSSQRQQLAEANARLSAAIGERDLEMNAMREKVATLTAAVREVGATEKGEVEQMLADTEAMQKAAQVLQAERDQAYGSLQAVQADNTTLKQQMALLVEREQKLQREVERLRSHLISIEEGYTQEALAAEEREKELRNKLACAEERAFNSSNAVQNYSVEASRQVESLQEQLRAIAEQRDNTVLQLASAKETASQYAASLTNLQMVLEQFQREREEQLSLETERYQRNLAESKQRTVELTQQVATLQAQLDEATDALEAAQRLSEQLDRKEEAMAALKEEVIVREQELKRAEDEIEKLATSSEAKVDKLIIKNLLMGYFHMPSGKRGEVLTLLSKVLNFTPDEMEEIGANGPTGGWLRGIFRRTVNTISTPPSTPKAANQSFSEMFVKFLERESSPQPTMKLPAEAMAREQQEKQQRQKPAFNPFSMPAHTTGSPSHTSGGHDSHILMKPMADTLPLFSTFVTPEPTQPSELTQRQSQSPAGSLSGGGSGRSTPASTSTILKDVLQQ